MELFKLIYRIIIFIVILMGILKFFQKNYFLTVMWIVVVPLLMLIPKFLFSLNYIKLNYNKNLLYTLEIFVLFLLVMSMILTLFLDNSIDFDSYVHFFNLILYTIIFAVLYYILKTYLTKKDTNVNESIIFSIIFTLIFGVFLWEKYEFYGDKIFGTIMYYDFYQNADFDSFLDKVYGSLGILFGSVLLHFKMGKWISKWKK